jgi:hypothetical protein
MGMGSMFCWIAVSFATPIDGRVKFAYGYVWMAHTGMDGYL